MAASLEKQQFSVSSSTLKRENYANVSFRDSGLRSQLLGDCHFPDFPRFSVITDT